MSDGHFRRGTDRGDTRGFGVAHAETTTDERAENQAAYAESLPERLRELWENPERAIDVPSKDFFREADPSSLDVLMNEWFDEMKRLVRKHITPKTSEPITEWTPWMIGTVLSEVNAEVNKPQIREYVLDRVLERHQTRYKDTLTGELSKAGLEQRFYTELKRLETLPDGRVMVLIEFDIDSFKKVNDMLGHAGADQMIVLLTKTLKSVISEFDSIGRRSGDELSIILNNVDRNNLNSILQRIVLAAQSIEFTKETDDGEEHSGQFMSITGSARVIEKGEKISYQKASKEADEGATFQKIDRPGSIIEWSKQLKPDLSDEEKREAWAEKLARNHIKRDTDALYAELGKHEKGSEKYEITLQQIERMNEAKEHWVQHYLAQIEKDYGPFDDEEVTRPLYETSRTEREKRAYRMARATLEQKYSEYSIRRAEAVSEDERHAAALQLARLDAALKELIAYELLKMDARYGEPTEP